ncbi:hypothetical protein [Cellulomonas taurus]|uniref:hypothetical protein n=1 Tax=Cellulomonas taurus TaxID=2729175 RepID=UPI00145E7A5B|nr:hypothetical protein [Cellulomonas taurus]
MGRPPDGTEPRTETVTTRFTPTGHLLMNIARGRKSRSAYIRGLVAEDVARRGIRLKEH